MKHILTLGILFFYSISNFGQVSGAWEKTITTDTGLVTKVLLIGDKGFTFSQYKTLTGAFIETQGGIFTQSGTQIVMKYEFDTNKGQKVGINESWNFEIKDKNLILKMADQTQSFKLLSKSTDVEFEGTFLFCGRESEGKINRREPDLPRKTMKLLAGGRFQWIAYNTDTKEFSGTGGGIYQAINGKYTETIEFFSKNNARVGASLDFSFEVKNNEWHHKGKSSAGDSMYEIWCRRQ